MSARSFFDSNVLVHIDDAAIDKRERALDLWQACRRAGRAVISVQVLTVAVSRVSRS